MTHISYHISLKKRGLWVGIAKHVGHAMTFKVLTDGTQNIIFFSNLHSNEEPMEPNLCLDPFFGEPYPFTKSCTHRDKQSASLINDSLIKD